MREQVKIVSDNPEGYCLKYREDLLPGDRKYYPPPVIETTEEQPEKKRKVKNHDLATE